MSDLAARLGTEYPLLLAPMAGPCGPDLAIAVGRAGGLAALPSAMLDLATLGEHLSRLAAAGLPFNVNAFAHTPPEPDAAADERWHRALAPFYRELGLDPGAIPAGPGRMPFDAAVADVIEPFAPRVVSFHFGLPEAGLVERVHSWGSLVASSATTVDEAVWLAEHGADLVIAQGLEAGGHRGNFLLEDPADLSGQMGTFALVPQVVAALDVPVVVAGGIATAAGVRAAMALGAAGVQVGTAYLCCDEALTSRLHRAALASPDARATSVTRLFTGRPARGIDNRIIREMGAMSPLAPPFPRATSGIGPLRAAAEALGSTDFTPLWSGQNASACRSVPAAEVTADLIRGFDPTGAADSGRSRA